MQHHVGVEHPVSAPLAAEQVGEVVEIDTDIEGLLVTLDVEVDLLRDLEIDPVHPRGFAAVALRILASVLAEVTVAADELLESGTVLLRYERHRRQLFGRGDVHQLRTCETADILNEVGSARHVVAVVKPCVWN